MLLHSINSSNDSSSSSWKQQQYGHSNYILSVNDIEAHIADSCRMVSTLYGPFKSKAAEQVLEIIILDFRGRLTMFLHAPRNILKLH